MIQRVDHSKVPKNDHKKMVSKKILSLFLVVFGIGKISDIVFKTEENVVAYKVEIQEKTIEKETASLDLPAFLALGTVDHGKKVFKKFAACHSINEGGKNKIGPALWSVMQRKSGELGDYKYSKALLAYDKIWSFEELNGFLLPCGIFLRTFPFISVVLKRKSVS